MNIVKRVWPHKTSFIDDYIHSLFTSGYNLIQMKVDTAADKTMSSSETNVTFDPEMEQLYMPSNWVVRVPPEQSVPLHVQVILGC